jgi:anti-sigma B factor antagonist
MSGIVDFSVRVDAVGTTLRATVAGELDLGTEHQLVAAFIQGIKEAAATRAILDLRQLTFVDSSGLRALLLCRDHATQQRVGFSLEVDQGPVTRLLEVAGVKEWFTYT